MMQLRTVGVALIASSALSLTAAGCSMSGSQPMAMPPAPAGTTAVAHIYTADGADAGTATATSLAGGGVRISIDAMNLPQGPHGAHIHSVGRCDPPDFSTAGGHWNPTNTHHGVNNPQEPKPHAGDMPNLLIGTDGRGSLAVNLPAGSFTGLMDADGSAIVIHSGPDDMTSDPSGNSGSRIACGVFSPGPA
ncbi:superoxide dismutase family protein [Stakelama marina]|uniref:Superoxide dismutase family protein n=1 Tax=Stakelama marina TaxID=2826939 RepID=A0A8T4IFH6_9SPHN|nr:superoxide dismutase family protein [Stakelama marina]MBR0553377.1 superoxide dismutase family protein [Stakelama marina]